MDIGFVEGFIGFTSGMPPEGPEGEGPSVTNNPVGGGFFNPGGYYNSGPTYNPPASPEYWTDGGIGCGGAVAEGGCPMPPAGMSNSQWPGYLRTLTPGQISQLVQNGGIPASAFENNPGLQLQVQQATQKFNNFMELVSNLCKAFGDTASAIARNV